jgi:hypothetical protein
MKHLLLFVMVIVLAAFSGCSNNSTSTPPGPTIVIPSVGSSWTFQNIRRDSNDKIVKMDTSTRWVAAKDTTYQGYSDVVMTWEYNPVTKKNDTVYIRYLSNGDISRLSSPAIDPALPHWFTVPFTTQATQSVAFGNDITYLGFTHDTVSFTASYAGTENDTVGSGLYPTIYPAIVITSTTWQHASSATKDSTNFNTQTNSFIPSKGIFGNRNVSLNQVNGKKAQRLQQILIGVNLK